MTQPIPSDRPAPAVADRDRSTTARAASTPSASSTETAAAAAPEVDTAHIGPGSALLRSAGTRPGSGAVTDAEQARALAARITEALKGDQARAMQAYAAISHEDVQALLATV